MVCVNSCFLQCSGARCWFIDGILLSALTLSSPPAWDPLLLHPPLDSAPAAYSPPATPSIPSSDATAPPTPTDTSRCGYLCNAISPKLRIAAVFANAISPKLRQIPRATPSAKWLLCHRQCISAQSTQMLGPPDCISTEITVIVTVILLKIQ